MKVELHAHTSESSGCGRMPGAELVERYAAAGYDTIVVTDHLQGRKGENISLEEYAKGRLKGYRAARAAGEKLGLNVLLGSEIRFPSGDEDILIYGVCDEDIPWLTAVVEADVGYECMYKLFHARGLIVVQAHPFRPNLRRIPHEFLDGSEAYNGHPGHNSQNDLALEYALAGGPHFLKTGGSDAHQAHHVARGGIETEYPIRTNAGLIDYLRSHPEMKLLRAEQP